MKGGVRRGRRGGGRGRGPLRLKRSWRGLGVLRGQGGPGALRQKGGAWRERPGEEEEEGRRQARQRMEEEEGRLQARQRPRHQPPPLMRHHLQQEQGLMH